jgi:hypothetical protein
MRNSDNPVDESNFFEQGTGTLKEIIKGATP